VPVRIHWIGLYHSNKLARKRSLNHKAAVQWNELPLSVQEITSLSVFKCAVKIGCCHIISNPITITKFIKGEVSSKMTDMVANPNPNLNPNPKPKP